MNVLALDLSLTATGVAHPDGSAETLRTKATGMARLAWLREEVWERTALPHSMASVDLVVIEGYSMGTARQNSHAHGLGELGGVIRLRLWEGGAPYVDVPPAVLKMYATGRGNAKKDEVLAEAIRRLGYSGSSHDEADALWLRALGMAVHDNPVVELPAAHLRAVDKARTLPVVAPLSVAS